MSDEKKEAADSYQGALAKGYTLMRRFPPGEAVVSMILFRDIALVATTQGVYRMMEGRLHPIEFVVLPEATADERISNYVTGIEAELARLMNPSGVRETMEELRSALSISSKEVAT